MEFPRFCAGPGDMRDLGAMLAAELESGAVVAIDGELGAGKTELVKGLAAGLGYAGSVTSPTFTLLHEYRGGRLTLLHFDFYRVGSASEILDLGWDESLEEEAIVAVEWAGRFPDLLPCHALGLEIGILPRGGRQVRRRAAG